MPVRLIRWSIENRLLVVIATLILAVWGWTALKEIPLDAIPDLSDVQIIVRTSYPGQSPEVVEEQVTYPITTTMLAVPGAKAVRGYSFFGDSYVYVVFEDGTDLYWARTRVLEYLNQAATGLPPGIQPRLGPDATGVGWIYSYVLVDRSGAMTCPSCAACRIGSSSSSSRPCRVWPRSRPSAVWSASTKSSSIRRSCGR
jgi:Cu(I)/Ag(I) efflux system membrane protein CusA/SilA